METIKVLFLAANPRDAAAIQSGEELRRIRTQIRAAEPRRNAVTVEFEPAVRHQDLLNALNSHRPHVVHFAGHGDSQGRVLLLDDQGQAYPADLAAVFGVMRDQVRLVVLNACYSESQAKAITEGIDCAVGTAQAIKDENAIQFAEAFYGAVAYERSVREAFEQGRLRLKLERARAGSAARHLVAQEKEPGEGKELLHLWQREGMDAKDVVLVEPGGLAPGREAGRGKAAGLPQKPDCFGREELIEQLVGALLAEEGRPVAVLGGPGMGKSTLVLAALHDGRVKERFGERRCFVRCDAATSRDGVVLEMGRGLGEQAGPGLQGRVLKALGEGPAVLVLDNLETPWEADQTGTEELLGILAGVAGVVLVATLRRGQRPAGVAWREALPVGALELAAARQAFLAIAGAGLKEDPELDGLLRAVDCVPLAVVLLAYQAEGQPRLGPLVKQWQQKRAEVLKRPGATDRLGNLPVSLELSIGGRRITEEGRRLLRVLGVLPEGMAWEDLEAVLPGAGEDGAKVLRQVGLAFDEQERLRVLAPVREFVREHYPPRDEDLDRVAAHYVALGEQLVEQAGRPGGGEAMRRLSTEGGNVEAMLRQELRARSRGAAQAACQFAKALRFGGWGSGSVLRLARDAARAAGELALEATCVYRLGVLQLARYDLGPARVSFEEARALFAGVAGESGTRGWAKCIQRLGEIAARHGDLQAAQGAFEEVREMNRALGAVRGEGNCWNGLGDVALARQHPREAWACYRKALTLFEQLQRDRSEGGAHGRANSFQGLGDVALARAHLRVARDCYKWARELYARDGDVRGEANALRGLGDVALARQDAAEARARYAESLALAGRSRDACLLGWAHERLARVAGEGVERREHVRQARECWVVIGRDDLVEGLR